ncbi:MAG: hypothetical protein ACOC2L_01515 [Candidatus Sumerlaeota bacterium]
MREYDPRADAAMHSPGSSNFFSLKSIKECVRIAGSLLGLLAIIIGLIYATRIFGLIYSALSSPEFFDDQIDKWALVIGGDALQSSSEAGTLHFYRVAAVGVLAGASSLLAFISATLMVIGARIISWTLSDREAIKRILKSAFGKEEKPDKQTGNDSSMPPQMP